MTDGMKYGAGLTPEARLARLEQLLIPKTLGTTEGDLVGFDDNGLPVRIPAAAGNGYGLTSDTTQTGGVGWAIAQPFDHVQVMRQLGSPAIASSMDPQAAIGGVFPPVDGRVELTAIYLPYGATLTGAWFLPYVAGVYTADNNTKMGLYTRSGSTYTRVAQSANDGNIFKATADTFKQVAFSSTYVATPGIYYVAFVVNWSALSTQPYMRGSRFETVTSLSVQSFGASNARIMGLDGQTDLPASSSSFTQIRGNIPCVGVY